MFNPLKLTLDFMKKVGMLAQKWADFVELMIRKSPTVSIFSDCDIHSLDVSVGSSTIF